VAVLRPAHLHVDDRAVRYLDVFPVADGGQVNVSVIPPRRLVCWHKHRKQTDYWLVVRGTLKVGIVDPAGKARFEHLTDRRPAVLEIPPDHWHGYATLEDEVVLVYYVTRKYDPSDELRATVEEIGVDWGVEVK
jgi:dTDP-4-dehydrorhamnose 3,5-epimerase